MIHCIALDDEPIALDILREYCRRYGDILLECFTSPDEAMACIRENKPDILFLDIELKSHNGIAIAREIPDDICLIFTTAYSHYALDGFDLNAADFLHKPIFYPRFLRAMQKACKWLDISRATDTKRADTITLKVEHKNVVIDLSEIQYIEAMDNYVRIYRREGPPVISQITMKEMETLLPSDRFMRVHRSFIIAVNAMDRYSNRTISLRYADRTIPIGRKYFQTFKENFT